MTIKRQFYFLIGGILLLPFLTLLGSGIIQALRQGRRDLAIPVYDEIAGLLPIGRDQWHDIAKHLRRGNQDTEFVVIRKDGLMVIFSTIEDFTAGEYISRDKIVSLLENAGGRYNYIFESPPWSRGESFYLLRRVDRSTRRPPQPLVVVGLSLIAVISLIFLFVIIMSVIILRSVTRSVLSLEDATARIARGELDVAVDASGSNEITSLARSLNKMRLTLKENELRRSRFIMGITHDLKTPLALIKGYAEAIEDGMASDPEALKQSTGIIGAKVEQLEGMVDDLIDFVRIDSREWPLVLSPVRLKSFLDKFVKRIENDAALLGRNVSWELNLGEGLEILMDERLVIRALENIINNGIRYTAPGGNIRLEAWADEAAAVIEITDDGPGIKGEDKDRVFDMFYRGSGSRREQGMGMGLAVVKSIAELHLWSIDAVSPASLGGACFRITIPVEKHTD